jgi:hypothetical protein
MYSCPCCGWYVGAGDETSGVWGSPSSSPARSCDGLRLEYRAIRMLKFDCGGGCEDRASRVDVDSVRLNEDEVGVSTSSWACSRGRERTDSEGGGKMNAGVPASTLCITRASVSGTRGVGGCA